MSNESRIARVMMQCAKMLVSLLEKEFGFTPWRSDEEWAKKCGWRR